jgi:hypothetical protein
MLDRFGGEHPLRQSEQQSRLDAERYSPLVKQHVAATGANGVTER